MQFVTMVLPFRIFLITSFLIVSLIQLNGQNINCTRVATLSDGQYKLSGTAYLERFEDGTIQLRFGDDFLTESGPDVQVFLANDRMNVSDGIMLEDLGTVDGIRHFSGALTMDAPNNITMATYEYVVLRCVTFQAFWGGGKLGEPTCDDPDAGGDGGGMMMDTTGMDTMMMVSCRESIVATTNWVSSVTVCPNDGIADVVPLLNNLGYGPEDGYVYFIVDADQNIKTAVTEDSYDFEGSSLETEFVFGVSFADTLNYTLGEPLSSLIANKCVIVSSSTLFLTVEKEDCNQGYQCLSTTTATTNWEAEVSICPDDGEDDIVPFINNAGLEPGEHFAYLITDEMNILVDVIEDNSSYNFEGSGTGQNKVFAVSYDQNLDYTIGENIASVTADGCITFSSQELFLTVNKVGCGDVASYSISGQIMTSKSVPLVGVEIVNDNGDILATTDDFGQYTIGDVREGDVVTLGVRENSSLTNGVSSTDIVLIARHILSLATFPSPYQVVAADVNKSGTVSASDIVLLKRIILGLVDDPTVKSWRFIDTNQQLEVGSLPNSLLESVSITVGKEDLEGVDFIGVKIGDVNLNATTDLD